MVDAWPLLQGAVLATLRNEGAPLGAATVRALEPNTPAPFGRGQSLRPSAVPCSTVSRWRTAARCSAERRATKPER